VNFRIDKIEKIDPLAANPLHPSRIERTGSTRAFDVESDPKETEDLPVRCADSFLACQQGIQRLSFRLLEVSAFALPENMHSKVENYVSEFTGIDL